MAHRHYATMPLATCHLPLCHLPLATMPLATMPLATCHLPLATTAVTIAHRPSPIAHRPSSPLRFYALAFLNPIQTPDRGKQRSKSETKSVETKTARPAFCWSGCRCCGERINENSQTSVLLVWLSLLWRQSIVNVNLLFIPLLGILRVLTCLPCLSFRACIPCLFHAFIPAQSFITSTLPTIIIRPLL